jgi:adenosylhomocysteine nucleosidase
LKSLLLLAALPEEADAFRPGEGLIVDGESMPVRIVEADETQISIVTCGLGKVNAALAVGRYANADTSLVAMTGTCGRIGEIEGDCFWIAKAIQHDYGARQADGFIHYRAGDWPMGAARDHAFTAIPDPGLGLPHAAIASGDVFLECAITAEALGLPWAAIKAVTDGADGESVGDFSANLKRAARKAGEAMERLVVFPVPAP